MAKNLIRVTGDPLSASNIKLVIKELRETAVAVSVVGTAPRRLRELAELTDTVADAMSGDRDDVRRAATRLRQLAQNVRISGTEAHRASRAIRALADGLVVVQRLLDDGIGNADATLTAGKFEVRNSWGYTENEARGAIRVLEKVSRWLDRVGLDTAISTVELFPGPEAEYRRDIDAVIVDPDKNTSAHNILRELGERTWREEFRGPDKETWGSSQRFSDAFATSVAGRKVDPETAARLQVTVGKLAANWPEMA